MLNFLAEKRTRDRLDSDWVNSASSFLASFEGVDMSKRIGLHAFQIATPGQHTSGSWRNSRSQAHNFATLDYWTSLAKTLERGKFDSLFLADVVGIYDVFGGSPDAALRAAIQVPIDDPFMVVSAMASVTEYLGFGVTSAITYEQPYALARKFSTLDHLTQGRIGFNVVTSYLESAARNLGLSEQVDHDERYDIADEFLDVVYKLWEGSWEEDAVIVDRDNGVYTDPSKVHPINHKGKYFTVPGVHLTYPSIQRTPVIFQAGASKRGNEFAAKHGEAVFINGMRPDVSMMMVNKLRSEAVRQGRLPNDVKVIQQMTVIVDETDALAEQQLKYIQSLAIDEGSLALFGGFTGIDMSTFKRDQVLKNVGTQGIQSVLAMLTAADNERDWTPAELAKLMRVGSVGPVVVGSPETVADELERWMESSDIDGFNLMHTVSPGSYEDFVELVVPELQKRGRVWNDYEGSTLREHFFGVGATRISDTHPASRFRIKTQHP